jgi:predicted MFS family arabinose efflux permease
MAIMPGLVPGAQLQAANALLSASLQLGILVGAAVGGAVVALAGPVPAFAADAVTFAVSAGSLALIRERGRAAPPGEPAVPGAAQAARPASILRFLRTSKLLQVVLIVAVAANITTGGDFEVALPALAHLRFGAGGYGTILSIAGIGAIAGTLLSARAGGLRRPALVAYLAYLVEAAAIALLPFSGGLAGAAAAAAVFGACNGFGNVLVVTWLQRWIPQALLGRAMSLVMLACLGSFPLSVGLTGILVRHIGPVPMFPLGAALLASAIVLGISRKDIRAPASGEHPAASQPGADQPGADQPGGDVRAEESESRARP